MVSNIIELCAKVPDIHSDGTTFVEQGFSVKNAKAEEVRSVHNMYVRVCNSPL